MQLIPEKGMRFLVGIMYRQYCGLVAEAGRLSVELASGWSTDNRPQLIIFFFIVVSAERAHD